MTAPDHSQLPLRDYDHLTLPSLAARIRSLTGEEITRLMEYERTHADRPLAIRTMEYRRDELASGAEPTASERPV